MSRREKKAAGLEQHKKLQREKDQKREETGFASCKAFEREEIVAFGK